MANFNIPADCAVDHFFGIVNAVDWFYSFSDDSSVHAAGAARVDALEAYATARGGLYAKIYADRVAYNRQLIAGNSAAARQPQLKDYVRVVAADVPQIPSVRFASKEQIAAYLAARIDDNALLGREFNMGEIKGELAKTMLRDFEETRLYDANICRVFRIRDLVVFAPAKGAHGACYCIKSGGKRIEAFASPGYFRAYMLKYYF